METKDLTTQKLVALYVGKLLELSVDADFQLKRFVLSTRSLRAEIKSRGIKLEDHIAPLIQPTDIDIEKAKLNAQTLYSAAHNPTAFEACKKGVIDGYLTERKNRIVMVNKLVDIIDDQLELLSRPNL
jgi:hypothetical protein